MTYEEALSFFDIQSDFQSIELFDVIDEKLFLIKNEVLQKYSVPSLLNKREKECQRIISAQKALSMLESPDLPSFPEIVFTKEPLPFLETYERMLSIAKLQIYNAKHAQTLASGIRFLADLQTSYHALFLEVMKAFESSEHLEIAASFIWDSGPVVRDLKAKKLSEESIALIRKEGARIKKLSEL